MPTVLLCDSWTSEDIIQGKDSGGIDLTGQVGCFDNRDSGIYKGTCKACGIKGHSIFYEGFSGLPYGPVPPDNDATIPQIFRQGDSHKLRIHAQICLELALKKWRSRDFFDAMDVEHRIRTTCPGKGLKRKLEVHVGQIQD